MPIYLYSNPSDEDEIVEIIQSIKEEHVYIKDGVKWNRVFTVPTASIDTKWDADNPVDFVRKSGNKRGTVGELMDKSKELSEERERKHGKDPIKEKMYEDYSKLRRGKLHPDLKKKNLKEKLKKTHFEWED